MQFYKNRLYRKLISVKNHLQKIKELDYFSIVSLKAINSYTVYLNLLIQKFDEIDPSIILKIYSDLHFNISPSIRFLQRSTTDNIPWSMVSCLDELLNEHLGEKYLLLFRPQWNFNYSVLIYCLIETLKEKAKKIFPFDEELINKSFSDEKIHVFSFPYLEKTNVLLHSVIGHEIGHFYHAKWFDKNNTKIKINSILSKLIAYYSDKNEKDLIKPIESAKHGIEIIKGMCREMFSDIIGYYIFGPSMLFSLFYISIFEEKLDLPSKINNYYPTIKYRIRVLYEKFYKKEQKIKNIKNTNLSEIITFINDKIEDYLYDKKDLKFIYKYEKEIKYFEELKEDFNKEITGIQKKFTIEEDKIFYLYDNLNNGFPINEYKNKPVDIYEILYVGWLKYFDYIESTHTENYVHNYQTIMRLLLKSLNSSYIHKKYLEKIK